VTYLLVQVDYEESGSLSERIAGLHGVLEVTGHDEGCCCKNCPWNGNHGDLR
jgi:hypothetical protein